MTVEDFSDAETNTSISDMEDETANLSFLKNLSSDLLYACSFKDCIEDYQPTLVPTLFLDHLQSKHRLVIKQVASVMPFLSEYADHVIQRVEQAPSSDAVVEYGLDEEDEQFRRNLKQKKIAEILAIQERERESDHKQPQKCLFCSAECSDRYSLFHHMFYDHQFRIGLLDNLVNVTEFLELLRFKIKNRTCIYCEKHFKNSATLKQHLRKKKHYKIHHMNRLYDRFYVSNYLEQSAGGCPIGSSEEKGSDEASWDDWQEDAMQQTLCLFCPAVCDSAEDAIGHMGKEHSFDLDSVRAELDYYDYVKLVNYIRRCTVNYNCINCEASFNSSEDLVSHLKDSSHTALPIKAKYDHAQFLFPFYEDDPLLCIE